MFIHAVSGCDSTSALYGQGKVGIYKKLTKSEEFNRNIAAFGTVTAIREQIVVEGMPVLRDIYGSKTCDSLDRLVRQVF